MDDKIRNSAHLMEIERLEQSGTPHPNNVPVFSIEAGGAGNCYYYSTFEALREAGLLEEVVRCLNLSLDKEEFHTRFRNLVADNSDQDINILIANICHDMNSTLLNKATTAPNEPNVYAALALPSLTQSDEITQAALPAARLRVASWAASNPGLNARTLVPDYLNGFSNIFERILGNLTIANCHGNSDIIKQQLKLAMRTSGVYVANIEVNIVKRLLLRCNVYSSVLNRDVNQLAKFRNRIVLRNFGEGHYQWFSFREDLFSDVREQQARESEETFALLERYAAENAQARGVAPPAVAFGAGGAARATPFGGAAHAVLGPTEPARVPTAPVRVPTAPVVLRTVAPASVVPAPRQQRYNANMEEAIRRSLANQKPIQKPIQSATRIVSRSNGVGVDAGRRNQAGISPLLAAAERAVAATKAKTKAGKKGGNRKSRRRAKSSKKFTRRRTPA